jgi:hypothetical protein
VTVAITGSSKWFLKLCSGFFWTGTLENINKYSSEIAIYCSARRIVRPILQTAVLPLQRYWLPLVLKWSDIGMWRHVVFRSLLPSWSQRWDNTFFRNVSELTLHYTVSYHRILCPSQWPLSDLESETNYSHQPYLASRACKFSTISDLAAHW